jgi:N utilization substance protein A
MVVNELRGEKIDIVPFSDEPADFVMKALSPAKVKEVRIHEDTGTAEVIVPDYQLSLAIGKEGQNARLAARLTGWRVDIKSETQLAEEEAYNDQDWAEGEWVVDEATGEQVWVPAEGGEAMSAEAYAQAAEERAEEVEEVAAELVEEAVGLEAAAEELEAAAAELRAAAEEDVEEAAALIEAEALVEALEEAEEEAATVADDSPAGDEQA